MPGSYHLVALQMGIRPRVLGRLPVEVVSRNDLIVSVAQSFKLVGSVRLEGVPSTGLRGTRSLMPVEAANALRLGVQVSVAALTSGMPPKMV